MYHNCEHDFLSHTVRQLHRDFARAGADVCQSMTFRATVDNFQYAKDRGVKGIVSERDINLAAVAIARQVADDNDAVMSVSLSESRNYKEGKGHDDVIADFRKQLQFFVDAKCDIDFIVCEVRNKNIYNNYDNFLKCFSYFFVFSIFRRSRRWSGRSKLRRSSVKNSEFRSPPPCASDQRQT